MRYNVIYNFNDRFRNWGPDEYEYKIESLEASNRFLLNRIITLKEQNICLEKKNVRKR